MTLEAKVHFPIVGIGASAGGLEALELFVRNVPVASGMAFVIVQHLDPTHDAMLAELLQRATPMRVEQVVDGTRVEPDHVYVIPPNKDLSVLHGVLHLFDPVAPRGLRLPIDYFFRSLAANVEDRSVAVILSGMGSDGTLGLKAIKEKAGVSFVQDPTTAKFSGMPASAIDAGLADVVAPVEEIPEKIIAYLKYIPQSVGAVNPLGDEARGALEKVVILLREHTGNDFSLYKHNTILRRIERRMGIHQIERASAYVRYLQENPQEIDLLFKELLIGVTSFFRDPAAWEDLKGQIMSSVLTGRAPSQPVRAWVTGCATGEEAYSLAMLLREAMEEMTPPMNHPIQMFATDLDRDAIDRARTGVYPAGSAADISEARLNRFFVTTDRGDYQVSKLIRESVIFAPHNVTMDPPFTKLDIVTCRNLLIYLSPTLQNKLLPVFHYSLRPGGLLFLGNSETVGPATDLFLAVNPKSRIFQRREAAARLDSVNFPSAFVRTKATTPPVTSTRLGDSLQVDAETLLLQRYSPAAVLVDNKGNIAFISGRTGKYLEPAAGKTNWNVFAMARDGLKHELSDAFRKALTAPEVVHRVGIVIGVNGGSQTIDLSVQALHEPETLRGMVMIVFTDVAARPVARPQRKGSRASGEQVVQLEQELSQVRLELQESRAEHQSSKEELNSINEEFQSANEELQSTNEELTTSKEEMQSMNEELQTLNHELQARVDTLSRLANDMKNFLDSTEVATVFLDVELKVRLFTAGSNRIFKLTATDVGRPLADLASELDYPLLLEHAREVLERLAVHEQLAQGRDGRWYRVRIIPYRTLTNSVDGVTITFADITAAKELEGRMMATQVGLEKHIEDQAHQLEQAGRERHNGERS